MARPRTIDADTIQTFHCSFVLRTALSKSADATNDSNVSNFVRRSLEAACAQTLGREKWTQLESARSQTARRSMLESFLAKTTTTRIRRTLDTPKGSSQQDSLDVAMTEYIVEFEAAKDDREVDLALAVALEEAVDFIQRIKAVLSRSSITKNAAESLQKMTARFPDSLRADFDAAILHRIIANQPEVAPTPK